MRHGRRGAAWRGKVGFGTVSLGAAWHGQVRQLRRLLNNMSKSIIKFVCDAHKLDYQEHKGVHFKKPDMLKIIRIVSNRYLELTEPNTTKQLSPTGSIVWKKVTVIKANAKTAAAK